VDNRILPLPERARNQSPRGIGQLPEQTLRNTNHIGGDKGNFCDNPFSVVADRSIDGASAIER
jgi:hypothetical protein